MNINKFSRRMIELLPRMIRGIAQRESNYLSRGKITFPQLWVMERLSHQDRCPMNELAHFLKVTRPAATGLVDRLIAQGLVSREGDSRDRRIVRVRLTPKGRRILSDIWEQKRRMLQEVFGRIAPARRQQYLQTLEQVVQILGEGNVP